MCESSVSFFFLKQYVILHNYWVQNWDQLMVALGVQEGHILTILGALKYDFCIDHGFSDNEDCIFWYISHFLYRGKQIGDCPYWCTDNRCQLDIIEGRILVSCSPAPSSSCRVTAHWLLYCTVGRHRSGCVRANTPPRARLTYQLIETTYAGEEVWKNQDSSRWKPRAKDRQLLLFLSCVKISWRVLHSDQSNCIPVYQAEERVWDI